MSQDAPTATAFVRQKQTEMQQILRRRAGNDRERTRKSTDLKVLMDQLLDYAELSRRSLGPGWENRTPAERLEFSQLLQTIIEKNYQKNMTDSLNYTVTYLPEVRDGNSILVPTTLRSSRNRRQAAISISYVLSVPSSGTGGFKVVDINTDGVSLTRNYANQFNRIITREGWPALIRKMKEKLAQS